MERLDNAAMTRPMRFETWLNGKRMFASDEEPPAIDAVEVVHGEWIREDETQALLSVMWHCSECKVTLEMNGIYTPIGVGYKFCPNCGAKMDKRGESEGK